MSDLGGNEKEEVKISFDFGGVGFITFIVFLPLIVPVGLIVLGLVIIGIVCLIAYIGERMGGKKAKGNKKES